MKGSIVKEDVGPSRSRNHATFDSLSTELILMILDYLRPTESVVPYDSFPGCARELGTTLHRPYWHYEKIPYKRKLIIQKGHLEFCKTCANLCRTATWLRAPATQLLYQHIIVKSNKGLPSLFCSLASNDELRQIPRSFVWAVPTSGVSRAPLLPFAGKSRFLARMRATGWPSTPEDTRIAELSQLDLQSEPPLASLLAAVLAMMPQLRELLLGVGSYKDVSVELEAFHRILHPQDHASLLQKLERVVFEPLTSFPLAYACRDEICMSLLRSCASVSRVEVKGPISKKSLVGSATGPNLQAADGSEDGFQKFTAPNVKELLIFDTKRGGELLDTIKMFPRLTSLELQHNRSTVRLPWNNSGLSSDINALSSTLEHLVVLTDPAAQNYEPFNLEYDDELYSQHTPNRRFDSPVIPSLAHMYQLKHLTIETVWLSGTWKLFTPDCPRLPDILPKSLEMLRLSDHWGSSTPQTHYYIPGLDVETAMDFYSRLLGELAGVCTTTFPNLREVVLALPSQLYAIEEQETNTLAKTENDKNRAGVVLADVSELGLRLCELFAFSSVSFSIMSCHSLNEELRSSWARIGCTYAR